MGTAGIDVYEVKFNGRRSMRLGVTKQIHPLEVVECLKVLEEAFINAALTLLLGQTFEAKTPKGEAVKVYLVETGDMVDSGGDGQIRGRHALGASRDFTI